MGIEGHRDRGIEKRERNRYEKEGEKVEHSRGSNVCVTGKVDKKRTETGNRSKAKEIKKEKHSENICQPSSIPLSWSYYSEVVAFVYHQASAEYAPALR